MNHGTLKQKEPSQESTADLDAYPFPIVGIGASAGGLEVLEQFFTNMPANCGMAFVVIQHLSPDHKGMLSELLQRVTKMKVSTVTDRMKVKPNCVYVIPSNKSMSILNGVLHLFEPVEAHGLRLPIDFFFRSLADDMQEHSIGVVFSGMGSDGSLGVRAIKEKAGIVVVQSPESAKFDSMPRCAMEAVIADIVAPVNELPEKLLKLIKEVPRVAIKEETEKDASALEKIIILLRAQTGNDFSQYKKTTMYRRIERRMGIHQLKKIDLYVRYLQENPEEADILFNELLIGVTGFFRDTAVWEQIRDNIIPMVLEKSSGKSVLRAWIPGCSTGEEAYSLAIVFKEALEKSKLNKNMSLQIFATDLDINAITKARKGCYQVNNVADVSPERLDRYFIKADDQYRVKTEIREMVVFAKQNIAQDPPFTKLDFLSCRNLLIYLDIALQKKLLNLFHYSLNPGGILLLGNSETHGAQSKLFSTINAKLRIYQHSGALAISDFSNFPDTFISARTDMNETSSQTKVPDNVKMLTDQLLLEQFSPAGVLATHNGDIIYLAGNIGKYLTPTAGKVNMNLFAMAKDEIRNELPFAFRKAMENFERIVLRYVHKLNEETQLTEVTIQQIEKPKLLKGKLLVVFTDVRNEKPNPKQKKGKQIDVSLQDEFKLELQSLKEELESTREEMQTSQEELKSTNEELQSTNEELQSTNEELTTSKEEMQSLNEELQTVNIELQTKIDDFVRVNNDMNNLLNSIEIATLFLDKELNIRQFTTPTTKIIKLRQSDIGRLFTDQVTSLDYPEMYNDAKEVLHTLAFKEKAVVTSDGRWFNIRIMPYRTFENKVDGLVITFINITESKQMEEALNDSQTKFKSLIGKIPTGIIGLSADGAITEFNLEAERISGYIYEELKDKNYFDLFIDEASRNKEETQMKRLCIGEIPNIYENFIKLSNGRQFPVSWSAFGTTNKQLTLYGIIQNQANATSI